MILKTLYDKLPYIFKVIALNIKTYSNYNKRYTGDFRRQLKKFNDNWYSDESILNTIQTEKLQVLLTEAFKYTQWYKTVMLEKNITLQDIQNNPFDVLEKMPILKKTDRSLKYEKFINNNPSRPTIVIDYTSGTSGTPTKNFLDKESNTLGFAIWKRFHLSVGINSKMKSIRLSGKVFINPKRTKKPFWIYNFEEKQLFMSTYHLTDENMLFYIKKMNNFKPEYLDGYPSAFYILSKYIINNKITLKFTPKAILVTAETLYDSHRLLIEKAFKCNVYNQYASSEGSPVISECVKGKLHLNIDSGVFEILNFNNKPAKEGEIGKLVVTSFLNYKTLLIRYDIGDTVLLPKKTTTCDCGCKMPIVEKIMGREDDLLWTKEKGFIGRMDTAYKGIKGIIKSQIIQETPTLIITNNIVDKNYTKDDEVLFLKNLKERLGNNVTFEMNYVKDIPLGANGKFIAVKRKFKIQDGI